MDNNEDDKSKLVTNKSVEDLIFKEEVGMIEIHRTKNASKSTIKKFELNMEEVTGVPNIMNNI
jgi:hypothetical protein